ncbi:K02A2.6-like [Cordylochernes scorpioides]|uniref:K02A2.6-like n=1 Tax=Cordylochernes scorpioides TaxID=51811 RepID=A0ABY6KSK5_9ARAC|nr:K02A2.6-like [Cordylochernes scorpioides]
MLEMMLRDRFVAGLSSEALQKRLLQEEDDVKLDRVLAIAVSYELAEKDASELHGNCIGKVTSHPGRKIRERHTPVQKYSPTAGVKRCYRCGERNSHLAPACPHKSKACYKCKKIGHLSKVCKAANYAQKNSYVHEQILSLKGETEAKVTLTLDGKVLKCVVDTGSPVTLMPKTIFKKFWKVKLFPTSKNLKTLCNNPIKLVGERDVFVEEAGRKLRLIVVDEGFPEVLLGREWLKFLDINYSGLLNVNVNKISEICMDSLIENYANMFNNDLGCLKDVKLNICIKRDAAPVFCKARSLPFAMKKKVEDELEDMVDKGILEPLDYADWAAPIVPVLKKDGRIRICGDFRSTANRAIILDKYPLPTIDEIFSKLSGSTVFSTLDLSMAYLQVELAEANGVVNINTTKGLFAYKRLPYGVAVAPNKFQRLMDNIFADIPGVACYIDDILVSGRDANEHKTKLELVFKRLEDKGLKLNKIKCRFAVDSVEYLGFRIDKNGLHPLINKIQAVSNAPEPKNIEWTWPEKPWHRLHMDLAGPFMGKMFLVIIDAHTKWLEIFILKEITSRTIIYHLRQVFARFGLPELLVTDNGRQFVSKEFEDFTKMNGIRHTKTSPYNPSTNGLAERYVREFKTSLRKNSGKNSFETNLERFLLAQRAFPQTVMKESPAELLMKRRLKTLFSNLMPKMEFKGEAFHDALKKQENFSIGSDVYFRNYAAGPKWKQGTILKLLSCRHYLIGMPEGPVFWSLRYSLHHADEGQQPETRCLLVRLKSELFEADTDAGEDPLLIKFEYDFRGREFEKQFACRFRKEKPNVQKGTFGKVIVERKMKEGENEPIFEFNLQKTGLESDTPFFEGSDRWSMVAIKELAGTLHINEESNWKKFANHIGFTKNEIETKLMYTADPFLAMVNLYQTRGGTPEEFVQALYEGSPTLGNPGGSGENPSSRWKFWNFSTPTRWRDKDEASDTTSGCVWVPATEPSVSSRKRSNPSSSSKGSKRRRFSDVSETMSSSEESVATEDRVRDDRKLQDSDMWQISSLMNTMTWRALGRTLGLEESVLLNIEQAYKATGFRECAYQMLLEWKGRRPKKCTFGTLYAALCKENMNNVAKQLAVMKLGEE